MEHPYRSAPSSTMETAGEPDHQSIIAVDHMAIAVNDLERAIDWYASNFNFEVIERRLTRGERTAMRSAVLKGGDAVIVLVQGTTPESQVAKFIRNFGCGVQHMALRVRDLDAAIERLSRRSTVIDTPIIADDGIRQVFLRRHDESGVRVELIERKGGEFTDRSVERLFREFEANDLY